MRKIPTLFKKDPSNMSLVVNEIPDYNKWVFDSETVATRKFDGWSCAIFNGILYKRWDNKNKKEPPLSSIKCDNYSNLYWVVCDRYKNQNSLYFEGFDALHNKIDGTYELCGERISTKRHVCDFNPERIIGHKMIKHGSEILEIKDFSFDGIKEYLADPYNDIEGVVFYGKNGQMCKIRKKDFGYERRG